MREQIAEALKEPDISCCDWELGKVLLANWKAGLPDQILSLMREEIKKELLTEEERQLVYIPCETCPIAIPTTGHAIPDFDIKECLDCAAKCHNQAQLQKILKALEE